MSTRRLTTGVCVWMLAALFAACDDDEPSSESTTGGRSATGGAPDTSGGGSGGSGAGGSNEAGSGGDTSVTLKSCLEQPGELQRPPSGGLPCDLLPPDFGR